MFFKRIPYDIARDRRSGTERSRRLSERVRRNQTGIALAHPHVSDTRESNSLQAIHRRLSPRSSNFIHALTHVKLARHSRRSGERR